MEKPKNVYARPMGMNYGGSLLEGMGYQAEGDKGGKIGFNCNSIINKIYLKQRIKAKKLEYLCTLICYLLRPATREGPACFLDQGRPSGSHRCVHQEAQAGYRGVRISWQRVLIASATAGSKNQPTSKQPST